MPDNRANFDHYIAQHYIKLFTDDSGAIYIGNIKTHSVETVTDARRIMGSVNWSVNQQTEDIFTSVETRVARSLKTLRTNPTSVSGLSQSTRNWIREFITLHYVRSTGIHNAVNNSSRQMRRVMAETAPVGFDTSSLELGDGTREESLGLGLNIGLGFEPIYKMKGCVALVAPNNKYFILGDNPLVNLSTSRQFQYHGAIFADDTFFWIPLNPKLGLFFAKDLGNTISNGPIRHTTITEGLVSLLNRAEVYMAVDKIVGNHRGLIRSRVNLPNIGPERNSVRRFGSSPLVINHNNAVYDINKSVIDELRARF